MEAIPEQASLEAIAIFDEIFKDKPAGPASPEVADDTDYANIERDWEVLLHLIELRKKVNSLEDYPRGSEAKDVATREAQLSAITVMSLIGVLELPKPVLV